MEGACQDCERRQRKTAPALGTRSCQIHPTRKCRCRSRMLLRSSSTPRSSRKACLRVLDLRLRKLNRMAVTKSKNHQLREHSVTQHKNGVKVLRRSGLAASCSGQVAPSQQVRTPLMILHGIERPKPSSLHSQRPI
jgi:hypothetical protein